MKLSRPTFLSFNRFAWQLWMLALFVSAFFSCHANPAKPTQPEPASVALVEKWLTLLDKGDYAGSWNAAGKMFQQEVTQKDWVTAAKKVRQPLGALISRQSTSAQTTKNWPEISGEAYVVQFNSSFANLDAATETVIFVQETNDVWKAAGYMVVPRTKTMSHSETSASPGSDTAVAAALKPIRKQFDVPAMAAAIVTSTGVEKIGAIGVRKRGTDIPVTLNDLWHLGSDTKAMTATLIARLVERELLKWDSTLGKIFPDLASEMHADFRAVTVTQLLAHRAGLPPNLELKKFVGDDVRALRLRAVREELAKKPQSPPGSKAVYSNLGYIIAGAIVEKITDRSWEDAIKAELFTPLQMTSAGFGGTGTPGKIDQPWPHTADGEPTKLNGPTMDNLPVMGPAGRVHCTMTDWAKFIQDQLRGARGEKALLQSASYKTLHTAPFDDQYALGWLTAERSWGGGKVLNHAGDNTMNFAVVWVAPKRDFAILVCVNQSGDTAFKAADTAIGALIKLHAARSTGK